MKFAYPYILYFLLLLIIPIIIHLFNFRKYKKIYFSSLQFIKKIEKETNATKTLRHYIILACRLLAFTALIFAFAQPYFPTSTESNKLNSLVPIYLDNSYSMSAKGTNGDLLNQAKSTVLQIADAYPREQHFMLVTNGLEGTEFHTITRAELQDNLDDIQLSPISRSITSPLESIEEYLNSIAYKGNIHYYAISDFQSRNLSQTTSSIDTSAYFTFLQVTPQVKSNLYIDSVWFDQPFQRVNVNNTLNIRIQNTGNENFTNVEVDLKVGGINRQALADLNANNSTVVSMNYTDKSTGLKDGVVEVMDANLSFDNRFYFTYKVEKTVNILIINDDKSTHFPELVYKTDDYYTVSETSLNQLKLNTLSNADLIVLNELQTISSGIQTQLKQLVGNGIHLLIIPSPNYDKTTYNNLLNTFQLPIYQDISKQEIRIGQVFSKSPFFIGMFSKDVDKIRMPPLKNYIASKTYTNANFNTLIQYENGMPLMVEQGKDKNVFAFYTAINPEFNNFGKSALFSSVLLRIGEISQGQIPLSLTLGSSDTYKMRRSNNKDEALYLKQGDLSFVPELENQSGFTSISVFNAIDNQSIKDGIYSISNNQEEIGKLALNYNRTESDMKYATEKEINNYFKTLNVSRFNTKQISTLSDIQQLTINKPHEYWRILLILALMFFLLEMSVIIFWKV